MFIVLTHAFTIRTQPFHFHFFPRVCSLDRAVPNNKLQEMNIENHKRSPPAIARIEFRVSTQTTPLQLEGLRRRVNAYVNAQTLAWKGNCLIRAKDFTEQSLTLMVWQQSHFSWQDASRVYRAIFGLHMHLVSSLRELGIGFRAADQNVNLQGSIRVDDGGASTRPQNIDLSQEFRERTEAMLAAQGPLNRRF
jgi:hypothetical protein